MIIHCTTIEQIKDVIATERIKFNTHPKVMLNDFGDKLCINTKGGYGTLTTFVGDIISYSEWKSCKPTDSEICERIKSMNEEVGYVADWNDGSIDKYYVYYNYSGEEYDYGSRQTCEILGVTYTTQSIAKQIVAELNEKRFVRV